MPVYAKKIATSDPMFQNRISSIVSVGDRTDIPVPNDIVLCNGCNKNIHNTESKEGYLIFLGKRELAKNLPYDVYCESCLKSCFPTAIMVLTS